MKFIKINKGGTLVNPEEIAVITSFFGDVSWLEYNVILKSGVTISLYQNRSNENSYMPREELIEELAKLDKKN